MAYCVEAAAAMFISALSGIGAGAGPAEISMALAICVFASMRTVSDNVDDELAQIGVGGRIHHHDRRFETEGEWKSKLAGGTRGTVEALTRELREALRP